MVYTPPQKKTKKKTIHPSPSGCFDIFPNNILSQPSRNYFLPQNIISCPKKLFHVTRNYCFLLEIDYLFCIWFSVTLFAWEKESNSCHMKYILVTGNKFLSKETNSSLKNLLSLVKLSLSPSGISTIFAWAYTLCGNRFPGSPWICRPAPNRVQIVWTNYLFPLSWLTKILLATLTATSKYTAEHK